MSVAKHVVHAMVSYQVFTSIAFDVAETKGAQFDGIEDGGQFISELSDLWQENKEQYKQMTREQMRNTLIRVVEA